MFQKWLKCRDDHPGMNPDNPEQDLHVEKCHHLVKPLAACLEKLVICIHQPLLECYLGVLPSDIVCSTFSSAKLPFSLIHYFLMAKEGSNQEEERKLTERTDCGKGGA